MQLIFLFACFSVETAVVGFMIPVVILLISHFEMVFLENYIDEKLSSVHHFMTHLLHRLRLEH